MALVSPMSNTLTPPETNHPDATVGAEAARGAAGGGRQPIRRIAPWVVALSFLVILGTVLVLLADSNGTQPNRARAAATATPSPRPTATATAAPFVTPTPIPGFDVYVDRADGFLMQYPLGWSAAYESPGAEFVLEDATGSPTYWVQIDIAGAWTSPGQTQGRDGAAAWVNFALNSIAQLYPVGSFERLDTPTSSMTIGGVPWDTGSALITSSDVRVQVFAAIHGGKPYVISLFAPSNDFDNAMAQDFSPMLQSFSFVSAPS